MAEKNGKKLKKEMDEMTTKLGYFQRVLKNYKVPIMIVFEGMNISKFY